MAFWKKKDNLIISAAVIIFLGGLFFWPNICALRAAFNMPSSSSVTQIEFFNEDGNVVTLEKFKGKPLIVSFWATWCPVCVKNMSSFNTFAKAFEAQGGKVISISEDSGMGVVKAYLARNGYTNLAAHLDNAGQLMTAYAAAGLPTTIFIDANGKEIERIVGGVDWGTPALQDFTFNLFGI